MDIFVTRRPLNTSKQNSSNKVILYTARDMVLSARTSLVVRLSVAGWLCQWYSEHEGRLYPYEIQMSL